jgi:hypothetical protein
MLLDSRASRHTQRDHDGQQREILNRDSQQTPRPPTFHLPPSPLFRRLTALVLIRLPLDFYGGLLSQRQHLEPSDRDITWVHPPIADSSSPLPVCFPVHSESSGGATQTQGIGGFTVRGRALSRARGQRHEGRGSGGSRQQTRTTDMPRALAVATPAKHNRRAKRCLGRLRPVQPWGGGRGQDQRSFR